MNRDDAILDYLQNRLSPDDRAAFKQAMAEDAVLAAEVDVMRSVRAQLATGPEHDQAEAVWNRLSASIGQDGRPANENRIPVAQALRYAAVALVAVFVWQFAVAPRTSDVIPGFTPASETAGAFVLQVKFTEDATLGEITELLTPWRATIIGGPGSLGILRVAFPDAAARQQAMVELSARTDLVEVVLAQ